MANEDKEEINPEMVRAINKALKNQGEILEKNRILETEAVKLATEQVEIEKQKVKEAKQAYELARQRDDIEKETLEKNRQQVELAERNLAIKQKTFNKVLQNQKILNKAADSAPDVLKSIFSGDISGMAGKSLSNLTGKIGKDLVGSMKSASAGATGLGAGFKAMAGPGAVLAIVVFVAEIAKLALKVGNAENAFMKATGANKDFARSLTNSYEETRKFGASVEETSAAMGALYTGFTDFTFQDKKTRESLTETATVLAKLGVSNQDFAASVQTMTKAMGMSADAAGQQMLNLEKFAEELGVAPNKLAADFAGAGNMLAKMGDQGVDAFKDLQIASKITGLEMQKILNIVDNFDTFEGAATQAGKLNAALGGNFVNAMDLMMETDPAARFEMIRESILNTVGSFDEMGYQQKLFYRDALGLSDVGELALVLAGNMEAVTGEVDRSSQSYEDAAARAKEVASFQEQLNLMFAEMIPILTPIVDMMREFLPILSPIAKGIGLVTKTLGGLLVLSSPLYGISQIFKVLSGDIDGAMESFKGLLNIIFHQRNSPTLFEGLGMMPGMFSDLGDGITGTSRSMDTMATTMESTPIPAAAETMAGTNNNGGSTTVFSGGNNSQMQTVRQPVEISLNGDKLEKFVVEVTGKYIKNVSLIQ